MHTARLLRCGGSWLPPEALPSPWSPVHILGRMVLWGREKYCHHKRVFSSVAGLYPLDRNNVPLPNQKCLDIVRNPRKRALCFHCPLVENHCLSPDTQAWALASLPVPTERASSHSASSPALPTHTSRGDRPEALWGHSLSPGHSGQGRGEQGLRLQAPGIVTGPLAPCPSRCPGQPAALSPVHSDVST